MKPLPFISPGGDLIIPLDSEARFHWWNAGQSLLATLAEIGAPDLIVAKYSPCSAAPSAEIRPTLPRLHNYTAEPRRRKSNRVPRVGAESELTEEERQWALDY